MLCVIVKDLIIPLYLHNIILTTFLYIGQILVHENRQPNGKIDDREQS